MRVLSLFSGVGGMDLGLESAGHQVVGLCEVDKRARSVLQRHWPDTPLWEDVATMMPCECLDQNSKKKEKDDSIRCEECEGFRKGTVDLVAGGSPCQDLSVAGKRKGLDGERSGLFWHQCRIADTLGAWVLWENVVGALSSNGGDDFAAVLWGLTGAWPELPDKKRWGKSGVVVGPKRTAVWRVLDAQYFGVAQRRRRIFVVAGPRDECGPEILFEPESLRGDPSPSRAKREEVAGTLGGRIARSHTELDGHGAHVIEPRTYGMTQFAGYTEGVTTLTATDHKRPEQNIVVGSDADPSKPISFSAGNSADAYGIGLSEDHTPPLRAANSGSNQVPTVVVPQKGGPYVKSKRASSSDDYETWKESEVAPTLNSFDVGDTRSTVVIPIQDGREIEKKQNGLGVGGEDDPSYTLDRTGAQSIAATSKREVVEGEPIVFGWKESRFAGNSREDGTTETLTTTKTQAIAFTAKDYGADASSEIAPTLRAGGHHQSHSNGGVMPAVAVPKSPDLENKENTTPHVEDGKQQEHTTAPTPVEHSVRRLTPRECERLMGWPDDWTRYDVDGKEVADSNRYKMCGNGVVSNVTEWIGKRLPNNNKN